MSLPVELEASTKWPIWSSELLEYISEQSVEIRRDLTVIAFHELMKIKTFLTSLRYQIHGWIRG